MQQPLCEPLLYAVRSAAAAESPLHSAPASPVQPLPPALLPPPPSALSPARLASHEQAVVPPVGMAPGFVVPTALAISLPGMPALPALLLVQPPPMLKTMLAAGGVPAVLMSPESAFQSSALAAAAAAAAATQQQQPAAPAGMPDYEAVLAAMGHAAAAG